MKKMILLFFAVCFGFSLSAQTLHTLIFINEQEKGREADRQADMRKMKAFVGDVSKRLNYKNGLRTHSGSEFTVANVYSELSRLNVQYNDIVIFYYHGHGANMSGSGNNYKWPSMHITPDNDDHSSSTFLNLLQVKTELENRCRQAKLVLCIADCCNGYYYQPAPVVSMEVNGRDYIKKLFTGFSGQKFIMVSASKPGQLGYSASTGSVYGDCFRDAVNYYCETNTPTWESVLYQAQADTKRCNANSGYTSEPQYEIYNKKQEEPEVRSSEIEW